MERKIWFYWGQGWHAAPWFVKSNYMSWAKRNPAWSIIFLDDANLSQYSKSFDIVKPNSYRISKTAFSDVLRLDLLAIHGGVWVDATLLCMTPLEDWLIKAVEPSGFFSFRSKCIDRDLASWYIAAEPSNYLVKKWLELASWYWGEHIFDNPEPWMPILTALEEKYCVSLEATDGFLADETLKLKIYPYFWVNYLHQRLMRTDNRAADIWARTPDIFCGPQSTFLQNDPRMPLNDYTAMIAAKSDVLMLKFDRRTMPEAPPIGSALEVLYNPWINAPLVLDD